MKPKMKMARVILFTNQMEKMTAFYRDVLGLELVTDERGWRELDAGGVRIGLHSGPPSPGKKGPKIAFFAKDVAAMREVLVGRGAKLGKVSPGDYQLCNGKDPDGNPIQLSNR
jgi:catechol 2,3-dioxygenase-like lactoylglutathione lyase family enzyme